MPSGFVTPASGPQTQAGTDSPVGVVTPRGIGGLYVDTAHGALYIAHGATSADWTALGGVAGTAGIGEVIGIIGRTGEVYMLGGTNPNTPLNGPGPVLSDAYAQWNGNGAGLKVSGNGTDGQQVLHWINSAGAFDIVGTDGRFTLGVVGAAFPTSNPHIVGLWWDNAGVLTKSAG